MEASSAEDLEALMEYMEYIPGHFHLELNLNCDLTGPGGLRRRDTQLRQESLHAELESESGCLRYAVRNLLGMLAFHLDQLEAAEETFRSICKEDPGNLNAWANLGYVYDKLERELEAGECVETLSQLMGLNSMEAGQEDPRLLAARCLAEQAFAHPYDVELDTEEQTRDRLTMALTLYNRAIKYGGELMSLEEKRGLYFKMAILYIRLEDIVKAEKDSEYSRLTHYNKGLSLLTEALKSENGQQKAQAWCYVGILLERRYEFSIVPMSIHDCGYSGSEPVFCYETAMKLASDDAFALNLLAKLLLVLGKHEIATMMCNMALNMLPDPELNWQAYCTRAKIKTMVYVRDLERAKQGHGEIPDRQNLTDARKDLTTVLTVRPCLRTHLEMAQVYYYMAVDALQGGFLVDEGAMNNALVSLSHALQCELGDSLPDLHVLRGRCLQLKGEEQNAADCFKRALELERPGSRDTTILRYLLQALLGVFVQSGPDPGSVITQLEVWVQWAEERYAAELVQAELRTLCRTYTCEVMELSRAMVRTGRLGLVRRLLETLQPKQRNQKRQLLKSLSFS